MIHYLANEDEKKTLSNVVIYGESRPIKSEVGDLGKESNLFDSFPGELLEKMQTEKLLYHAHDWVIKTDTYKER